MEDRCFFCGTLNGKGHTEICPVGYPCKHHFKAIWWAGYCEGWMGKPCRVTSSDSRDADTFRLGWVQGVMNDDRQRLKMRVGKTVWMIENSEYVPVKLITFGKGNEAEVEYIQPPKTGKRRIVMKIFLKSKKDSQFSPTDSTLLFPYKESHVRTSSKTSCWFRL